MKAPGSSLILTVCPVGGAARWLRGGQGLQTEEGTASSPSSLWTQAPHTVPWREVTEKSQTPNVSTSGRVLVCISPGPFLHGC